MIKLLKNNFFKIGGLIKIFMAELLAVLVAAGYIAQWVKFAKGYESFWGPGKMSAGDYMIEIGMIFVVILLFAWLIRAIVKPRIFLDQVNRVYKVGPVIMSGEEIKYPFISTHPSYIFIDLLIVGSAWFSCWVAKDEHGSAWVFEKSRGIAALILSGVIPLLRLASWYIFSIRPKVETDFEKKTLENASKPVFLVWALFFGPILLVLFGGLAYQFWYKEPRRIASLPVVNSQTMIGGLLKHPELQDLEKSEQEKIYYVSKEVRVQGIQKNKEALKCKPYGPKGDSFGYATVLLDLGAAGEVLVLRGASENFYEFLKLTQNKANQTIEVVGRLRPMPTKNKIPNWKVICGYGELGAPPPAGRMLLEAQ